MTIEIDTTVALDKCWAIVRQMLGETATPLEIEEACRMAEPLILRIYGVSPGLDAMRRRVESELTVIQPEARVLDGPSRHSPWLPSAKSGTERPFKFWHRYHDFLQDQGFAPAVLRRLDDSTDDILGRLFDPRHGGEWLTRGLVVGEVQSGKTANFIGLLCKAADAGYPVVVILAGAQNSLRSQTQLRVDEGFVGIDTQYAQRSDVASQSNRIGVGLRGERLKAASFTTSAEHGDFKKSHAQQVAVPLGAFPAVLVIKKHVSIMRNLRRWITDMHGRPDPNGPDGKLVHELPLLILDDEADQASINTAKDDPDTDPTKVNQEIRLLLTSFTRRAYVGYTATPFANLYADEQVDEGTFGPDLFPSDFIVSLRAPSNHFGPIRVFGLNDPSNPERDDCGLPIFREVSDTDSWLPDRHTKDTDPGDIPESLQRAVASFILSCAARRARGELTRHNSMLIHATRFQQVQDKIADQISQKIYTLRSAARVEARRPQAEIWRDFSALWAEDYERTTRAFAEQTADPVSTNWDAVRAQIPVVLDQIQVRAINGSSRDALDYYDNRTHGLTVIAIGGNKLSRGLTLEGLSVSYYLRASRMYDTLLQMGRWFGYRPGYEDLCRLYTTKDLYDSYGEITAATEELRRDLEQMAAAGRTPRDYGLGVQTSPNGLLVTSPSKMRRAETVKLTFSGSGPETSILDIHPRRLATNWAGLLELVDALKVRNLPTEPADLGRRLTSEPILWRNVPPDLVARFLDAYRTDRLAQRVRPDLIARYIRRCAAAGELGSMAVLLASVRDSGAASGEVVDIGGQAVRTVVRNSRTRVLGERFTIKRILSPNDELADLDFEQKETARETHRHAKVAKAATPGTVTEQTTPDDELTTDLGLIARSLRRPDQGLMILYPLHRETQLALDDCVNPIGFKMSFPFSDIVVSMPELKVNRIWLDFGGGSDSEEAED